MRKEYKLLLTGFVTAAMLSCGKQDPLDGQADVLLHGRPPGSQQEEQKPADRPDALRFDQEGQEFTFQETVAGTLDLKGRILIPNYDLNISIENLSDFPGATFDSSNNTFAWTPPEGFVANLVDSKEVVADLKIVLTGIPRKSGEQVYIYHSKYTVRVTKNLVLPEVLGIATAPSSMREGASNVIKLKVFDRDATAKFPPEVKILSPDTGKSLAPFISIESVKQGTQKNEWLVDLRVDLCQSRSGLNSSCLVPEELTKSSDVLSFKAAALSRFEPGKQTPAKDFSLKVYTLLSIPVSNTWVGAQDFTPGQEKSITFQILDPDLQGVITVHAPKATDLPKDASLVCSRLTDSVQSCTFTWKPEETDANKRVLVRVDASNKNKDAGDPTELKYTFTFKADVGAIPPPSSSTTTTTSTSTSTSSTSTTTSPAPVTPTTFVITPPTQPNYP